jgi:oligopeptide/dipeptide ABC transporter ATP-binding protein
MYLGEIVEIGDTEKIFNSPAHPYTRLLINSVPDFDRIVSEGRYDILGDDKVGEPPSPINPPSGCKFRTRCPFADDICAEKKPDLSLINERFVSCHFAGKI